MISIVDPVRLFLAGASTLAYAAMCIMIWTAYRSRQSSVSSLSSEKEPDWVVAFASQTGTAEELARKTALALEAEGIFAQVCSISMLQMAELKRVKRILFIASTYGEGDPPDNAASFARMMADEASQAKLRGLSHLEYAVLALGDGQYQNFCGFGKALDQWMLKNGASQLFERIDVNQHDAASIEKWRNQLSRAAGLEHPISWDVAPFAEWILVKQQWMNPGSAGFPVYHLEMEPVEGKLPDWRSGDLVQVRVPGDMRPREYSIASVANDGKIHMLVRQHMGSDGKVGLASGWLTQHAKVGSKVLLRLRHHPGFRLEDNSQRPLILIGNGTGMAGLRSHLKERERSGMLQNWLIFGERHAACDFYYKEEIEEWRTHGILQRTDICFSRDNMQLRYVQDCIRAANEIVCNWVKSGAAIYVCGSLKGMAEGVDEALREILGNAMVNELSLAGRYRRDVY